MDAAWSDKPKAAFNIELIELPARSAIHLRLGSEKTVVMK
jgi:hypothetical protein